MKQYIAFVFEQYGAGGGWNDVISEGTEGGKLLVLSRDTLEEAKTMVEKELTCGMNCAQIVDLHTGQIVA